MANLEAIKADANKQAKILADYLRKQGLLDEYNECLREYKDEAEEVLHGASIAAYDLARRIATL